MLDGRLFPFMLFADWNEVEPTDEEDDEDEEEAEVDVLEVVAVL